MDGLIAYGWVEEECCTDTYKYNSHKRVSVMIRSNFGGAMTLDQVPMTEVGELIAKLMADELIKPHQVIAQPSGERN